MEGTDAKACRYGAFVSYRHVEPDRRWATWLHRALEAYRVPRRLVQATGAPRRVGRVFRDEEELPASAHLSVSIEEALRASKFLIVVCSPRTPSSEWVNKEVVEFRRLGRGDRILALLIEGLPAEAFPPALQEIRQRAADATGVTRERIEHVEPLAADVRPRPAENLRTVKRRALLRLVAGLIGCGFDDLRRREQERQRRQLAVAGGILLGAIAVLTGLMIFAFQQRALADHRAVQLQQSLDDLLRLRDVKTAHDLEAEIATPWPILPSAAPKIRAWISRAEALLAHRPLHERLRESLRASTSGSENRVPLAGTPADEWLLRVVAELMESIDRISQPDRGHLARARAWADDAESLERRSLHDHAGVWKRVVEEVREADEYGITLVPQLGLVPLGRDPESRLQEFVVVGTGSLPTRDAHTGLLALAEDFAVVLVLLPERPGWIGQQGSDADVQGFVQGAKSGPPSRRRGAPIFVAKFELTIAQWDTLAVDFPAQAEVALDEMYSSRRVSRRYPRSELTLRALRDGLARRDMRIPSRAEWELSARGGCSGASYCASGGDRLSLVGNLADNTLFESEILSGFTYETEMSDGFDSTAPVGSFLPNPCGLFDVLGNVQELVLDAPEAAVSADPDPEAAGGSLGVRGDNWRTALEQGLGGSESLRVQSVRFPVTGVRPVRDLRP